MNKAFVILLISCLCVSGLDAQKYPKRKILKDLKELPGFDNAFIGFKLYDPEKEKTIAEQYAEKHMTPASNTKLFTYYAGTKFLPDTLSALEYVERGDSLIFWSTGYPLTLHHNHRDSTIVDFLQSSDKQLYYWPRHIIDERFGPGWGWDDYGGYYGAEKSTFPIYGNSIQFIINNEEQSVTSIPNHPGFKYKIDTTKSTRNRISRDEYWNEFKVQFKEFAEGDTAQIDTLVRPFRYSNEVFVDLLGDASGKGIKILEDYSRPIEFETLPGVKADSLYKWMLQPSDNLFAESILLMVSASRSDIMSTSMAISLTQVSDFIKESIFDDGLVWRDGSGLSRYNMFKPDEHITLLADLLNTQGEDKLFELLPQGETSGTIKSWYSPNVYAKTGTLSNNHSLSGYLVTDKGKTLIFTIQANHYTVSTSTIKESFGVILDKIKRAY